MLTIYSLETGEELGVIDEETLANSEGLYYENSDPDLEGLWY